MRSPMAPIGSTAFKVVREGIEYFFLDENSPEWELIEAHHRLVEVDPPNRRISRVAVAKSAGGTSYFVLQPILHCEPLHICQAHKHTKGVLTNLIGMQQAFLQNLFIQGTKVWAIAEDPSVEAMCEALGFQRVEAPVYVKHVRKD